jgi:hypothetical protein
MAHRAVTTATGYLMTTRCRPSIDRGSVAALASTDAMTPHIIIFPTSPKSRRIPPSTPKDADGRVDRLAQRRRLGLVFTDMAALHHTKPLTWNKLRDTNPIARGPRQRVRGVPSMFNRLGVKVP